MSRETTAAVSPTSDPAGPRAHVAGGSRAGLAGQSQQAEGLGAGPV